MLRDAEYDDNLEVDGTEAEDADSTTGGPLDTDDMMEDLYGDGDGDDDDEDEVDEAVKQAWGGI
jgi:hypothetical protein